MRRASLAALTIRQMRRGVLLRYHVVVAFIFNNTLN